MDGRSSFCVSSRPLRSSGNEWDHFLREGFDGLFEFRFDRDSEHRLVGVMVHILGFEDRHTCSVAEAFNNAVPIPPARFRQPSKDNFPAAFGFANSLRSDDGQHSCRAVPIAICRADLKRFGWRSTDTRSVETCRTSIPKMETITSGLMYRLGSPIS